ncbi:MAG: PQQ-binding-like beta-propeller repeat protein [Rhodothermales bacterium]
MITHRSVIVVLITFLATGCSTLRLDHRNAALPIWSTEGETPLRHHATPNRITPPLDIKWDFNGGAGFGTVSPLIVGDVIFVANLKGEVHAIDIESGRRVGRAEFGDSIEGTPVYADGTLVIPIAWGGVALYAHNLLQGDRKWRVRGAPVSSGLVVYDGTVIAGDVEGIVRAYSLSDGEELWSTALDSTSSIFSTPTLVGERLIAASDNGRVVALDVSSGSIDWSVDAGAPVHVSLAADEAAVYAATTRGRILALDIASGATRWEYLLPGEDVYFSAPAIGEWEIVFGASDGIVRALNVEDGSQRWTADVSDAVTAPPVLTDHLVYVGTMGGNVVALDRAEGTSSWQTSLEGRVKSAFAVKDSRLVVLAEPRLVYLLEPSSDAYANHEE